VKNIRTFLGSIRDVSIIVLLIFAITPLVAYAATQTVTRSVTVTATVLGPPPTTPAVITSPSGNITVGVTPLVVSGTCGPGLEVRLTNNGVLVGTTTCALDGTFTINISLNEGTNNLAVLNFDTLNQAGPASAIVTVLVLFSTPASPANSTRPVGSSPTPNPPNQVIQPPKPVTAGPTNPIVRKIDAIGSLVHPELLLFFIDILLYILLADVLFNRQRIIQAISRKKRP